MSPLEAAEKCFWSAEAKLPLRRQACAILNHLNSQLQDGSLVNFFNITLGLTQKLKRDYPWLEIRSPVEVLHEEV